MKDFYDGKTYDLKTRVDIWTRMDMVPVEYGNFSQKFNLKIWFFQFITGITFKWDHVMWNVISLLMWIGICTKLSIYRVPTDPARWYCQGFGSLWQAFMMIWMLGSRNDLKVSNKKQVNYT